MGKRFYEILSLHKMESRRLALNAPDSREAWLAQVLCVFKGAKTMGQLNLPNQKLCHYENNRPHRNIVLYCT